MVVPSGPLLLAWTYYGNMTDDSGPELAYGMYGPRKSWSKFAQTDSSELGA